MSPNAILDLIVVTVLIIAIARGWKNGSLREGFGLAGLLLGIIVASLLIGPIAGLLEALFDLEIDVARVIALGGIVGVFSLGLMIAGIRLSKKVGPSGPRWLDGTGGGIFAALRSLTAIWLFLYGTIAISTSDRGVPGLAVALDESTTGRVLSDSSSPAAIFYDTLLTQSDDLRALTLRVRQQAPLRESVPTDRLDFSGTDASLTVAEEGEREMLTLINEEREDKGLPPLDWCQDCAEVARSHSKDMYRNGYFSHVDLQGLDPFERMKRSRIAYGAAGENLSIAPSIEEGHDGLMNSPDHRANILRPVFDEVGIGCYSGPYGFMCTQVFRSTLQA